MAVFAIALGIVLRTVASLRRGGLAEDEVMLALNIATRGYRGLLLPLDYAQTAPIPFLWAERLLVQLFGVDACALRMFPYVASCATLVALWKVGGRLLDADELAVALGLGATSPFLLDYSAQVKPYSLDGLVTVLLVGAGLRVIRTPASRRAWAGLAATGTVALLLSTPAMFVLAGVVLGLAWLLRPSGAAEHLPRLLGLIGVWALVVVLVYLGVYRSAAHDPYMQRYWALATLEPGPRWLGRSAGAVQEALWPVSYWMVSAYLGPLLAAACVGGIVAVVRRLGGAVAWLLGGPIVSMFLAAAVGAYPVAMRLTLFATPLLVMLAAVGLVDGARRARRRLASVRPAAAAMLVLVPSVMVGVAWCIEMPGGRPGLPAVVHGYESARHPDEPVYLFHRLSVEWLYHTTDWSHPDTARLAWVARIAGPRGPGFVNAGRSGPRGLPVTDTLVYHGAGHDELYGTASGVQGRAWLAIASNDRPSWSTAPDPGWADAEVARIRRYGSRRIWAVFKADSPGEEVGAWFDALARAGGRVELRWTVRDATLVAVRFDVATLSPAS